MENPSICIDLYSGVDHCGHRYGPSHLEMKRKLNQMNDVIRNLTQTFDQSNQSSLLIVIGDHGMTQQGDHGGDELNEIQTAMFLYTNQENYFHLPSNLELSYSQIDLVPTFSWFVHSAIPFSNLGMIIPHVIPVDQRYLAMKINFEQIENYLQFISLTIPLSDRLQELRADLRTMLVSFDRERNLSMIENLFEEFRWEFQGHFRRQWSTFNLFRIILGLILMFISSAMLIKYPSKMSWELLLYLIFFAIPFSNSFIINEGMCLYFLLQTIILFGNRNHLQEKFLLSFLVFLSRAFLICREEQQPYCIDPVWLLSKSSDTSNVYLPFLAAVIWLIILLFTCDLSYILPYISYISVVIYWFDIPQTLSIVYISILIQICWVIFHPSRLDTLIYSILIFVVDYRYSPVILIQYFLYYISKKNSSLSPLFYSILAEYFFYASGHQPVLSQIRWTAAFPTTNSPLHSYLSFIFNSLFIRGLFVLIETFSSQIFNVICLRKMFEKNFLKQILIIDCWKLMITAFSVFLLRRHLMLWKIFSPRFLFQFIGFSIKLLFAVLTIQLRK